jgi:hypothetical protein
MIPACQIEYEYGAPCAADGQPLRVASTAACPSAMTAISNAAANRSAVAVMTSTYCTTARESLSSGLANRSAIRMLHRV